MFFQFIVALGIWLGGLIFSLFRGAGRTSPFEPAAILGGVLWATGNVCVVPIMKTLGLSLGLLIWGSVGTARFTFDLRLFG